MSEKIEPQKALLSLKDILNVIEEVAIFLPKIIDMIKNKKTKEEQDYAIEQLESIHEVLKQYFPSLQNNQNG